VAREYAQASDSLVLVDGWHLADLMIEEGIGVSHRIVRIAKIDSDYFDEV